MFSNFKTGCETASIQHRKEGRLDTRCEYDVNIGHDLETVADPGGQGGHVPLVL